MNDEVKWVRIKFRGIVSLTTRERGRWVMRELGGHHYLFTPEGAAWQYKLEKGKHWVRKAV